MKNQKLLLRILKNQKNVKYDDFAKLLKGFGFELDRAKGSHYIYKRDGISELINIQNVDGEVKPYQIKQLLSLVEKYNLNLEE